MALEAGNNYACRKVIFLYEILPPDLSKYITDKRDTVHAQTWPFRKLIRTSIATTPTSKHGIQQMNGGH